MQTRIRIVSAMLVLLSFTFLSCSRPASSAAPSFTLPTLDGRQVSLEQFRGKIVLLDFWATWCGPCRLSMPLLEKLHRERPEDFVLLAINLQEPLDLVRDYVGRQNIKSMVLLDKDGEVGSAYHSESIPMQVLIDQKGIIRHVQVGFSPRMTDQLRAEIEKLRAG